MSNKTETSLEERQKEKDLLSKLYQTEENFTLDEIEYLLSTIVYPENRDVKEDIEYTSWKLRMLFKPLLVLIDTEQNILPEGGIGMNYPTELLRNKKELVKWIHKNRTFLTLNGIVDVEITDTVCELHGLDPEIKIIPVSKLFPHLSKNIHIDITK
jgi:hypothetical protein